MKKTFVTIFVVVALVLSSGINARAFAGTDFKIHTRASVSDYFSDTSYANIVKNIYSYVGNQSSISGFYSSLNGLPAAAFNYDNYILLRKNGYLRLVCFNGSSILVCSNSNMQSSVYSDNVETNWYCYIPVVNGGYSYTIYQQTANNTWEGTGTDTAFSGSYYALYLGGVLLDTNLDLYYFDELVMKSIPHSNVVASNLFSYPDLYSQLTVLNNNIPYVDGEGSIIDPTPVIESNSNHMYFKGCEIGFCYPKNSASPSSFGGAYFYIKYQVDDWIVNHISDYDLVFYADCEVGNDLINTTRYQIALDPDGCITIPFNRLWTTPLNHKGFSVLVTDTLVEDNFYKAYLYSLSSSSFIDFGARTSSYNGDANIVDALSALLDRNIAAFLYYTYDTDVEVYTDLSVVGDIVAQKYNPFLIDAFTLLSSGDDNSGLFEMEFDLVAGTEDVTDTSGIVNPDPFIPDDSSDPDFTPPAPSPGNSTTPSIIVNTGGTWNGVINGVIGYDPGYTQLKNDINANPDANFSQYLAPFRDNEVGGFVSDFLDDMPTAMKSIFIGGFGVLTLLGIYRFIRRG